ncbi:hypothetical protein BGW41_004100 [Actinomortierella wolfii]|nr:hypothetical protein BGW41_004100 [Actinomortierella wolfii]
MTGVRGLAVGIVALVLFQATIPCYVLADQSAWRTPSTHTTTHDETASQSSSLLHKDVEWEILGPFPSGMREQDFGADPLEPYGGFRSLRYDPNARFASELAQGGTVGWHKTNQDDEGWVHVLFPEIPWQFNEKFLGWGFNQYQAWARTTFRVPYLEELFRNDREMLAKLATAATNLKFKIPITVQCQNIGDFYVDDKRLSGDWYGYGITRHTVHLEPGTTHTLSVRIAHEVRIFGGVTYPPPSKFKCYLNYIPFAQDEKTGYALRYRDRDRYQIQIVQDSVGNTVVMDAIEDQLAGNVISMTLRNVGQDTVYLYNVEGVGLKIPRIPRNNEEGAEAFQEIYQPNASDFKVSFQKDNLRSLSSSLLSVDSDENGANGPFEAYPIHPGMHLSFSLNIEWINSAAKAFVKAMHQYGKRDKNGQLLPIQFMFWFDYYLTTVDGHKWKVGMYKPIIIDWKPWGHWYRYTFTDFDGSVQYAVAIPPQNPSLTQKAPMLVALHGASVDVQVAEHWLHAFERRDKTWIVLPTGRASWGFDWHGASTLNVENAIRHLAEKLPGVPKRYLHIAGIRPDPNIRFMAGHSNGGQGCWYMTTHYPDKAIAATPSAGYVNIKQYVPYTGWLSNSFTDPALRGVLEAAIAEYDNDVYMSNAVGIPILARVGSIDDNVAPFNSRKMVRLGQEHARNQSAVKLSEIPGMNHWFEGILQGQPMEEFQQEFLHDTIHNVKAIPPHDGYEEPKATHPTFPSSFVITLLNPASMGTKGGIQVEQLRVPFRKGQIRVHISHDAGGTATWRLHTTNIRRFTFPQDNLQLVNRRGRIHRLIVDDVIFENAYHLIEDISANNQTGSFLRVSGSPKWQFVPDNEPHVAGASAAIAAWKKMERHRETYGPPIQVFEKPLIVVVGSYFNSPEWTKAAQHISRIVAHDIYQYSRVTPTVLTDYEYVKSIGKPNQCNECNMILIGDAFQNSVTSLVLARHDSPVGVDHRSGTVYIDPSWGLDKEVEIESETRFTQPGTGLLMLRPLGHTRLALIIAGVDVKGMEGAARLFPKRTGLLVPDWVVTGPEMPWKGAGGILAAGYV